MALGAKRVSLVCVCVSVCLCVTAVQWDGFNLARKLDFFKILNKNKIGIRPSSALAAGTGGLRNEMKLHNVEL